MKWKKKRAGKLGQSLYILGIGKGMFFSVVLSDSLNLMQIGAIGLGTMVVGTALHQDWI